MPSAIRPQETGDHRNRDQAEHPAEHGQVRSMNGGIERLVLFVAHARRCRCGDRASGGGAGDSQ